MGGLVDVVSLMKGLLHLVAKAFLMCFEQNMSVVIGFCSLGKACSYLASICVWLHVCLLNSLNG